VEPLQSPTSQLTVTLESNTDLSNMDQLPSQIVLSGSWSSVEGLHQMAEYFVEHFFHELLGERSPTTAQGDLTAGCIDTDPPVGRRTFGQSDKPSSRSRMCTMRCGSSSLKSAVALI